MKNCKKGFCILFLLLVFGNGPVAAFFIRWPWNFFPGTTSTTATAAASVNYGFLRPAILVPVPTTTTAATTTTTSTTPRSQFFINGLLGSSIPIPTNNASILLSLFNSLSGRPVIGGIAQPFPIGGSGIVPGAGFPGVSPPVVGGIASATGAVGGIATGVGAGGLILPSGFPATGGIAASGIIPGIIGRSAGGTSTRGQSFEVKKTRSGSGRIIFANRKKK